MEISLTEIKINLGKFPRDQTPPPFGRTPGNGGENMIVREPSLEKNVQTDSGLENQGVIKWDPFVPGSIHSHYFHIIGDKLINPIVRPIIRIPY